MPNRYSFFMKVHNFYRFIFSTRLSSTPNHVLLLYHTWSSWTPGLCTGKSQQKIEAILDMAAWQGAISIKFASLHAASRAPLLCPSSRPPVPVMHLDLDRPKEGLGYCKFGASRFSVPQQLVIWLKSVHLQLVTWNRLSLLLKILTQLHRFRQFLFCFWWSHIHAYMCSLSTEIHYSGPFRSKYEAFPDAETCMCSECIFRCYWTFLHLPLSFYLLYFFFLSLVSLAMISPQGNLTTFGSFQPFPFRC